MSRTDNTRPYVLRAEDPTVPGEVWHEHGHSVRIDLGRVPVTWGDLKAMKTYRYTKYNPGVLFAAYSGVWTRGRDKDEFAESADFKDAKRSVMRYLVEIVPYDAGDEFTDTTIVGYRNDYRFDFTTHECDHTDETGKNRLHYVRTHYTSGTEGCCTRLVFYSAGRSKRSGIIRTQLNRQSRQKAKQAMKSIRRPGDEDDFDIVPGRYDRRNVAWLVD